MQKIMLDGILYQVKREYSSLFLCQMIDNKSRPINAEGMLIENLLEWQKMRYGYGVRIISKSRLQTPMQLKLF